MISAKSSNLSFLFLLSFSFSSSILESQTQEDLSYLDLLPSNQSQSIAERLGIQTGKPINDEVVVESFDEPRFQSSTPNTSLLKEIPSSNTEIETFGLNIFKESPTTFAPIDLAPAPLDYVIGPGDELRIQLFGTENINRLIKVNREGNIVIPEIGSIQASGLKFSEFNEKVKNLINASLIGTNVEVSLTKVRSIQIFVLGNALNPGAYTVSSLSNITNVLFFSGGPNENGSLREISLKRDGVLIGNFDFYDLLINGNISSDLKIMSNDVLVINPIRKSVKIMGEIRNPAKYELLGNENFSDLLRFSSGFATNADKNKITLSRLAKNGERIFKNYPDDKISEIKLEDGDEIYIHKMPNTPRNIIKIFGETASKGSIAFEENLSVSEIIKPESFLESTYTLFAIIERENNLGSKSLIRANLLGNSKILLEPNDSVYILSKKDIEFINSILVGDSLGLLGEKDSEKLSNYFGINNLSRYQCKSLQLLAKQSESSSMKFIKSKYLPNPKIDPIDQLEFVDSCPAIFEEKPYLLIFTLENASIISGEVRNPGIYPSWNVSSPSDLLSFAGGKSERASNKMDIFSDQGLSIKIDLDENTDLSSLGISAGFYANISSLVSDEVFSISLEGAFISPGIYGAKQGEKLSDVIRRAGGYKKNAYPYGGILARKSVAEKEKIAFLKSADQLEESIATAISSGRISSVGGDPTLALTSISRLISNLEDIEPIGRVVTEFDLDILERSPEKDLLLERGDRIFIPERSSTITVSGQVLSPTSFSFDPKLKVRNYIDLAGGYSEDADKARTLVIYPNGRASRIKNWPNSPDLAPGTTLVVPRDPNPFDWLVFSQVLFPIISNFATSAAAIAALGNNN